MTRRRPDWVARFVLGAILAALALGSCPIVRAQDASHGLFERGSEEYQQGDYEAAVESFTGVLDAGYDDPIVHYNLANAWFKSGHLGMAIYHYRRAHALAPRDEDIRANLDYARFLALDRVEETAPATDLKVEGWLDRITAFEVLRIATALWVLAALAGILGQLLPAAGRAWRRACITFACVWVGTVVLAWVVHHRATASSEAVVLAGEARVRSGPASTFDVAFVLHEGAEVVVEGERGTWTEISLPGELRGWVDSKALAKL